jgi:hypothetical protein
MVPKMALQKQRGGAMLTLHCVTRFVDVEDQKRRSARADVFGDRV